MFDQANNCFGLLVNWSRPILNLMSFNGWITCNMFLEFDAISEKMSIFQGYPSGGDFPEIPPTIWKILDKNINFLET